VTAAGHEGDRKATPVIPPVPEPDARLPYHKPRTVPLRQQVAQLLSLMACVTASASWLLMAMYVVANSNGAGVGSFAMMLATGLFVFLGDASSLRDARPRLLVYATLATIGNIVFFAIIEFARR